MGDKIKYSNTQSLLKQYILNEINHGNRVIAFSTDGHFGAEYVLKNLKQNVKVFSFFEAINMNVDIIPIIKSIMMVGAAIATGVITIINGIGIQAAANNALNSALPDKGKKSVLFQYFFGYSRFNKKYKEFNKIIYLDDFNKLSEDEITKFKLIKNLIENKKIRRTILVVSTNSNESKRINRLLNIERLKYFSLTKEDIKFFLELHTNKQIYFKETDLSLIKLLGLNFLFDYYLDLMDFTTQTDIENNLQKIQYFLQKIFDKSNIDSSTKKQLNSLLCFVSVFYNYFSKLQIANYNNNLLYSGNLNTAVRLSILKNNGEELYSFNYKIFREFYFNEYKSTLKPTPNDIFNYIYHYFPLEYITLLRIIDIDNGVCNTNFRLALLIKAYFFACKFGSENDRLYVLNNNYCKNHSELNDGLHCNEHFIFGKRIDLKKIETFREFIVNKIDDPIAVSMGLIMILHISKECIKTWDKYDDTLFLLMKIISTYSPKNKEEKYLITYFKELYIAFAIETDEVDREAVLCFKHEIEDMCLNDEVNDYIAANKVLRKFSRLQLLSNSIDDPKMAENNLLKLSKNATDIFTLQMAYNNLCVFYIEELQWNKAYCFMKRINSQVLLAINADTHLTYLNNKLLIEYFTNKINIANYLINLQKIIEKNSSSADLDIVKNNYIAAKLSNPYDINDIICDLKIIINQGNKFSQFYSRNNLLYALYQLDDRLEFMRIKKEIFDNFPIVLNECLEFFQYKYNYLIENWSNKNIKEVPIPYKYKHIVRKMYSSLIMFGGIERWYE